MTELEDAFQRACDIEEIRGAVLLAANADGSFQYHKAFGQASRDTPFTPKSTFWIASCSKLITAIAAIKLVEDGYFGLDDDVREVLHELKDIQILKGFDNDFGKPILEQSRKSITLRQLLSHSSGLGYDFTVPLLEQWRVFHHEPVGIPASNFTQNYLLPLLFEPGESWEYGAGLDWAGILIERLSGENLQQYVQKRVWDPLGIRDMTFHLEQRPDMRANLASTSKRSAEGKLEWVREPIVPDPSEESLGGAGVYSTAQDYFVLLRAVLANDGRIISQVSMEELFRPQLSTAAKASLCELMKPEDRSLISGIPPNTEVDYSLAGLLNVKDIPNGRKRNSISWGGYPNLKWWIDRTSGICGLYASQLHPPGDPASARLCRKFQAEMYSRMGELQAGLVKE